MSDNLTKVAQRLLTAALTSEQTQLVSQRIKQIIDTMVAAPKSLKWRARAKVGRRIPWYDLPEEVD
jgi:hypothetical protein